MATLLIAATSVPARSTPGGEDATRASLRFDRAVFGLGHHDGPAPGCLRATLTDADEDRTSSADAVTVIVSTTADRELLDRETLVLVETAPTGGVFATPGCVPLRNANVAHDDGLIGIEPGAHVLGAYVDPDSPALPEDEEELTARAEEYLRSQDLAIDTAIVTGLPDFGVFAWEIDPALQDAAGPMAPAPDGEPVTAGVILNAQGFPSVFPDDQVVLEDPSDDELAAFLAQYDGTELDRFEVPQEAGPQPEPPASEFVIVRVDPTGIDLGHLDGIAEAAGASEGFHRFGSETAAQTMTLVLAERLGGREISLDQQMIQMATPNTDEGSPGFTGWFATNDINVEDAIARLDLVDRNEPHAVDVAIIDSGFAGPADYRGSDEYAGRGHPDFGDPFTIAQANCLRRCRAGTFAADGPSAYAMCAGGAGAACDWHGTGAFSVALAIANNEVGALGVAGHARDGNDPAGSASLGRPILAKVGSMLVSDVARAIRWTVEQGADVINISAGVACEPVADIDFCNGATVTALEVLCGALAFALGSALPGLGILVGVLGCGAIVTYAQIVSGRGSLRSAIGFATSRDVVVVASGPEKVEFLGTHGPFDAKDIEFLPCVARGVTCVGMLKAGAGSTRVPDATNTYGSGIDIWAPGDLRILRTPAGIESFSGTSAAAPFIAGVAALVRAADPSLTDDEVTSVLRDTTRTLATPNGRPPRGSCVERAAGGCVGVVDALAAVDAALAITSGCDPFDIDERNGNDSPETAAGVPMPDVPIGGDRTVTLAGVALHAMPQDGDWFKLERPQHANVTLRIDTEAAWGNRLWVDVFRDTDPSPAFVLERLGGSPVLPTNSDVYLQVGTEAGQDLCARIELTFARRPGPDRFEVNDQVSAATPLFAFHQSPLIACGRSQGTRADCRDIFKERRRATDGIATDASVSWAARAADLSSHTAEDRDFFSLPIPDPRATHTDVTPDDAVAVPLPECGSFEIRDRLLGGTERVTTTARLVIRATPEGNALSERAMRPGQLQLYVGGTRRDDIATGSGWHRVINCPRDRHGLTALTFSIGEDAERTVFDTGGYRLDVTYEIEIHRAPDRNSYRFFQQSDFVGRLGCFTPAFDAAGAPKGANLASFPRHDAPYCGEGFGPDRTAILSITHPADPQRNGTCIACQSLYSLPLGQRAPVSMRFTSWGGTTVRLLDRFGKELARTRTAAPGPQERSHLSLLPEPGVAGPAAHDPAAPAAGGATDGHLFHDGLEAGMYFLAIEGAPDDILVTFDSLPDPPDADGDGVADAWDLCGTEAEDLDGFEDGDGCADPDNDADGVLDVVDNCPMHANADQRDTDGDLLGDACDDDDDADGLTDEREALLGTHPLVPDTDGDRLLDGAEVDVIRTDPLDRDTDGDLFADGTEVDGGSDPRNPLSIPTPAGPVTVTRQPPYGETPVLDDRDPIF